MARAKRAADGGLIYQVLNRANARMRIFDEDADFEAFERILVAAVERTGADVLAFCLMPNHWHLVLQPHEDGELSIFWGGSVSRTLSGGMRIATARGGACLPGPL